MSSVPGCLRFGGFPDKPTESQSAESSQPGRPRNRGRQSCIHRDGRSSETPGLRAFSAQATAPVSESDNRGQNRTQRNEENPTARVRELRTKNSFAEAHLKVRVRVRNRARAESRAQIKRAESRANCAQQRASIGYISFCAFLAQTPRIATPRRIYSSRAHRGVVCEGRGVANGPIATKRRLRTHLAGCARRLAL